jgi:hypothetical protein
LGQEPGRTRNQETTAEKSNPECNRGLRDVDIRQQLQDRKRIKDLGVRLPPCLKKKRTMKAIKGWSAGQRSHLGSGKMHSKDPYEIFGRKIAKQVVRTSRRL